MSSMEVEAEPILTVRNSDHSTMQMKIDDFVREEVAESIADCCPNSIGTV